MTKNICIISHQHLCRNPRVLKESIALEKVGFHVTILTSIYSAKLLEEDYKLLQGKNIQYIFYNNLIKKDLSSYINRSINKLGRRINKIGFENKWALGYAPTPCFKMAIRQHADIYICHQELPTYIGILLLKKGKKVAFDIEDWYTQDLLPEAQKYRPQRLLAKVEHIALNTGNLVYTTSVPLVQELAQKYQSKEPEVIYNSFDYFSDSSLRSRDTHIKLIWISQTIGPGRGLEEFVQALNSISILNFELNLRGNTSDEYKSYLTSHLTNNKHQINFLPIIPNREIQQDLVNYDIGLATEHKYPTNKDLTISNKIFHYLSVGLPVIASATKGQLSLKDDFKGSIFYFDNNAELIKILSGLQKEELIKKTEEISSIYQEKYDWSFMEKKLQNLYIKALS